MAIAVDSTLELIRDKVEAGERLDLEDGLALMESDDLLALGELAVASVAATIASTSSRTSTCTRRTSAA
jgi:2-iminoacetate synthase ThiH